MEEPLTELPAQGNYYLGGGIVDDTIQVYIIKESTLSVVDSFSYDYVEDNLLSKLSEAINAYNLITSALVKIDNSSRSVLKESAETVNIS